MTLPASATPSITFDHAALATLNNAPIRDFILDLFGGKVLWNDWSESDTSPFRGVQIQMGQPLLEMIAPGTPDSFIISFVEKRGPGLHHLTWKADRIEPIVEELREKGIPLTGVEEKKGRLVNAFIRPSASFGVLTQLRPSQTMDEETRLYHPARLNVPSERPLWAALEGVGITATDGLAVRAFFHNVLGGELGQDTERDGVEVRPLHVGGTRLEFWTPTGPDSDIARSIEERGAGLHHLIYRLIAPAEVLAAAATLGLTVTKDAAGDRWIADTNPAGALFRLLDPLP